MHSFLATGLTLLAVSVFSLAGGEVSARSPAELAAALRSLAPGATVKIGPGEYPGGNVVTDIADLTIEALEPGNPPVFRGGNQAWHFSRCSRLTLRHLKISGQKANGINLDDGGERDHPVTGVKLEDLQVGDIGPQGNHDAIKISGLDDLVIRGCRIEGWGGQGIDLVGCHRVQITGCELMGKEGFSATAGIQMKGGCAEILVEKCRFVNAGLRPVNLGGSTGMDYFRPAGTLYEARAISVRDCEIRGGQCAAAFTGLDGGEFTGNTIVDPEKWIFRILQETRAEGFSPCRNVTISGNRITFLRSKVKVEVNIGDGTAPETFRFQANRWLAQDRPEASRPRLPVAETDGTYGSPSTPAPR